MYLTRAKYRDIISQVAQATLSHQTTAKKYQKKSEKTFEKGIDKWKRLWYNIKVAARVAARSLKIEQQERSTKLKIVCVLDLEQFKENTTQNKSKKC